MRLGLAAIGLIGFGAVAFAQSPTRITTAANVRLRAAPAETAAVVASLPLGADLLQLEASATQPAWVRVRTARGDGWLPTRLTRKVTADSRIAVIEAVVQERLGRDGDSFAARAELVDFVARMRDTVASDPDTAGRFALHWLRAVHHAAAAVPRRLQKEEPYAPWLAVHGSAVFYNEIGGGFSLTRAAILEMREAFKATAAADDIAWLGVEVGLPGECEGFVACYIDRLNIVEGGYLRAHSAGRHVTDVLATIALRVAPMSALPSRQYFLTVPGDCGELARGLEPLRAAVLLVRADGRLAALAALDALAARCKGR
jgi:hypothetical protein